MAKSLAEYQKKRDFSQTPEPLGKKERSKKNNLFVIQLHDASHVHYDFRLEIEGVLVSWAIPKGPSQNPRDKRLAIKTEDHPVSYGEFEGVIPEGNYGAGTVMIWDQGTYKNIKPYRMDKAIEEGHLEFFLDGERLKGNFALIKTKKINQWLLIKMKDEYASTKKITAQNRVRSVVSGKTLAQIQKESHE